MAHCPYNILEDLNSQLDEIRDWDKIKENSPGTFYLKSKPFLHFHINKEDRRWADVKKDGKWPEIEVPFKASLTNRKKFLAQIKKYFKEAIL
jgi:hypothetical protein